MLCRYFILDMTRHPWRISFSANQIRASEQFVSSVHILCFYSQLIAECRFFSDKTYWRDYSYNCCQFQQKQTLLWHHLPKENLCHIRHIFQKLWSIFKTVWSHNTKLDLWRLMISWTVVNFYIISRNFQNTYTRNRMGMSLDRPSILKTTVEIVPLVFF